MRREGSAISTPAAARPLPVPDETSGPYWSAAADHILALARCARCGSFALPPDQVCPHCRSTDPDYAFEPVSGRGTVRSWTVVRQSGLPGFAADLPFVLVDVELAEQTELRMIGRLLDGPGALAGTDPALRLGARVQVAFEDVHPGVGVPAFTLAEAASVAEPSGGVR
ncbi:Zn-ribbon domain-containing OB-fold protein [Parafrankia sp. FMc2]|uniref:Zn-ribbon domain-containing OB-fold protein n=1 Tax=Parafrankia sp. FMc2 TaxID=3233196 RepID=UPI0034D48CA5